MPTLYYHPLASYCWKVLIALYENGTPFERRIVDLGDPAQRAELAALWPPCKFPVLVDEGRVVGESSIVVEWLDRHRPGPRPLVPRADDASLEVRLWDRIFDAHVQTPMQEIVLARLRGSSGDVSPAYAALSTAYGMIEQQLRPSGWIASDDFGLADCAAAPALFYAVTLVPFGDEHPKLGAYFERLVAHGSVRRVLDEAKPYLADYPFASAIAPRFR